MKIHDSYTSSDPTAAQSGQAQRSQESSAVQGANIGKAREKTHQGGTDEVSLSGLATVLQDALTETPERTARLEKLAEQFEAGKYQVDAATVAGSLVTETLKISEHKDQNK